MGDGIEDCLSQGFLRNGIIFHPLHSIIGNQGFEIFGAKRVERFVHLAEEVAMNFIVKYKIGIGAKAPNFDKSTGYKPLGIGMEEKDGCSFQVMPLHEMQFLKKRGIRFAKNFRQESLAAVSALAECSQREWIELRWFNIWNRDAIPMPTLFSEKKAVQSRALQFLFRASASVVVFAFVADGIGVGFNDNLHKFSPLLAAKIDIH